jgi:uncharacterized protein with ParB-like and HNH nuclease domain
MENAIHSLENLFNISAFSIPQYQRAYAWEIEPHLTAFLSDLRQQAIAQKNNPNKTYYLGTLLLQEVENNKLHIGDGQQRLSTSVIFLSAAINRSNASIVLDNKKLKSLKHNFIFDEIDGVQKFKTINDDNPFFYTEVLKLNGTRATTTSPSASRLKKAFNYFIDNVDDNELVGLIQALITAKVMVYSVNNAADATLIFEL